MKNFDEFFDGLLFGRNTGNNDEIEDAEIVNETDDGCQSESFSNTDQEKVSKMLAIDAPNDAFLFVKVPFKLAKPGEQLTSDNSPGVTMGFGNVVERLEDGLDDKKRNQMKAFQEKFGEDAEAKAEMVALSLSMLRIAMEGVSNNLHVPVPVIISLLAQTMNFSLQSWKKQKEKPSGKNIVDAANDILKAVHEKYEAKKKSEGDD